MDFYEQDRILFGMTDERESDESSSVVADTMNRLVNSFPEEYLGRYVLTMKSRSSKIPVLYLVDRKQCDTRWWSPDPSKAYVIIDRKHAEDLLKTYSRGDVQVKEITRDMTRYGTKMMNEVSW